MKKKTTILLILLTTITATVAGVVSAQQGRFHGPDDRFGSRLGAELVQIITEATGLDVQEIRDQLEGGQTLAELIEANGGSVDDVVAQLLDVIAEQINQAVDNNRMTQERADDVLDNLETHLQGLLDGAFEGAGPGGRFGDLGVLGGYPGMGRERANEMGSSLFGLGAQFMVEGHLLREVADATDQRVAEVMSQIRDGSSLAEILTANEIDVAEFSAGLVNQYQERLDAAVADGILSEAVADARLNLFQVELNDWLNRSLEIEQE